MKCLAESNKNLKTAHLALSSPLASWFSSSRFFVLLSRSLTKQLSHDNNPSSQLYHLVLLQFSLNIIILIYSLPIGKALKAPHSGSSRRRLHTRVLLVHCIWCFIMWKRRALLMMVRRVRWSGRVCPASRTRVATGRMESTAVGGHSRRRPPAVPGGGDGKLRDIGTWWWGAKAPDHRRVDETPGQPESRGPSELSPLWKEL